MRGAPPVVNLLGQRFGRLTVIAKAGRTKNYSAIWTCRCDCGGTKDIASGQLRGGRTTSCGCRRLEALSIGRAGNVKHGAYRTKEYKAWSSMRERCLNPRHQAYGYYGGRGITICAEWDSFERFLADMGPRPSPQHSLDRIDNSRGYSAENCRWAVDVEQLRNRRFNRILTHNGKSLCVAAWAEEIGVPAGVLHGRLARGWSDDRVVSEPYKPIRRPATISA